MRREWQGVAAGALAAALALASIATPAAATVRHAAPRAGEARRVLEQAVAGDTVVLARGVHDGPLRVARAIVLRGEPGACVDGGGRGRVLEVVAAGATVADLEIRGSGSRLITADAGLRVGAPHVRLLRLRVHDVLYGIYAERADALRVEDCALEGRVAPLDERGEGNGNGIHLWMCGDVVLERNRVTRFLDAVYLSFSHRTRVEGNALYANGRYGLHTMYCQRGRLVDNLFTRNAAGIAIMFSNHLEVERNAMIRNRGPRTYGLLLRDCSDGRFLSNRLIDNTVALFLDGSNRNQFLGNRFEDNGWGLLLFASSADNVWSGNDFIHNDYPVALDMRRTRNRFDDGARGNYWSEAGTFDLDGDGVGDVPHGPVTAFAFVSKQYPDLSVLARSPAVAALGVAERVFPSLRPSEAVDRFPASRPFGIGVPVATPGEAAPQTSWPHVAAFSALGLLGLAGLAGARR